MAIRLLSSLTSLQRWVILVIALLWIGGGALVALAISSEFPGPLAKALAAVVAVAAMVVVAHIGILRLFSSRPACLGLIIGKVCVLPMTGSFGLFGLALVAMSTDGSMKAGADIAYATIGFGMAITAVPALAGAFVGAAIGQMIDRRNRVVT
jgi:hypothetical protein